MLLSSSPALSTSRDVEFHITEINDNAPQFVNPIDSTVVKETIPVGEIVTLVSGSDGKIVSYTKIACYIVSVVNNHGLQGFTIDCRCTRSISPFYIIIMKCAQNLRFLVDQKPNSLKLLGGCTPRPPASEIHYRLNPSPTFMCLSQKEKTSSYTDIIVKSLPGITDKFERKRTTLSYTHIGASF